MPQEKLQELFEYFTGDRSKDEDNSQILEALAIIQQSPEFMKEATRSSLLGTMPPQPKERVSDNVMGREFKYQRDFLEAMKKYKKDPFFQVLLADKEGDKSKGQMNLMKYLDAPSYAFTPEVKELLGLSNGGSVTDAIARLENGGEPEDQKFKQMLQDLIGSGILDNLSEEDKDFLKIGGGVTAMNLAAMPIIKSLIEEKGRLNKRFFNPEYDFKGKELESKNFQRYMKEMIILLFPNYTKYPKKLLLCHLKKEKYIINLLFPNILPIK